ncbi:MAG: AraC family transcriptional regulator [Pseudomonadota bacterium]
MLSLMIKTNKTRKRDSVPPKQYQDTYPENPLLDSADLARPSAMDLLRLEYFEAQPASMSQARYSQHHVLLNLNPVSHRVENWRDEIHRDFVLNQYEIIVTPAGMLSGWKWYQPSKVIVITLEPDRLEKFAQNELGVLLGNTQLQNLPQFNDPDICHAGELLRDSLASNELGSAVMFESFARVFLVKLIQKYGEKNEIPGDKASFTAQHYKRVLDFVDKHFGETITLEDMASEAALSSSHFSRIFKQTIGKSPMQFLTSFRIEQAKKMLADQLRPQLDIALSCGFADQAHFSRVFKQLENCTPSSYRDTLRVSI